MSTKLLRMKQLLEMIPVSRSTMYQWIKTEAIIVEGRAEGKLLQAESREKDTSYMQNTLRKEIDECRTARATADEQIRICEEKLRKGENTERELDKAKRAIEKLQRQIRRLKNENEE